MSYGDTETAFHQQANITNGFGEVVVVVVEKHLAYPRLTQILKAFPHQGDGASLGVIYRGVSFLQKFLDFTLGRNRPLDEAPLLVGGCKLEACVTQFDRDT